MRYRALKAKDVTAKLTAMVGSEGAKEIGVCRFCKPEQLEQCKVVCKYASTGVGDLFSPRYRPEVMAAQIQAAATEYRARKK